MSGLNRVYFLLEATSASHELFSLLPEDYDTYGMFSDFGYFSYCELYGEVVVVDTTMP